MMITDQHIFYLVLLAFWCVLLVLYAYSVYREAQSKQNKYKLFKVRDDLIYLVARKIIAEDDIVFQEFYGMINIFIMHLDKFTISSFIRASIDAKKDLEREERINQLMSALHKSNPDAIRVVDNMFKTILNIMIDNSTILKWIIRNSFINSQVKKLNKFLTYSSMYQQERDLYYLYTDYNHLREKLGLQPAI
jgi:hypothetical protein